MQEIPPETPQLPSGESNLISPSAFNWRPDPNYVAPTAERIAEQQELDRKAAEERWARLREAPDASYMQQINQLSIQYQELVLHWWPHIFGRRLAEHLPPIASVQQVLDYALSVPRPDAEPVVKQQSEYAKAHMAWIAECAARKAWLEGQKSEWQRRRQQFRDAKAAWALQEAQWRAYVAEAQRVYNEAEAYPVPVRPMNPDKE